MEPSVAINLSQLSTKLEVEFEIKAELCNKTHNHAQAEI